MTLSPSNLLPLCRPPCCAPCVQGSSSSSSSICSSTQRTMQQRRRGAAGATEGQKPPPVFHFESFERLESARHNASAAGSPAAAAAAAGGPGCAQRLRHRSVSTGAGGSPKSPPLQNLEKRQKFLKFEILAPNLSRSRCPAAAAIYSICMGR
jgi:hypothetical protein